MPNLSSKQLLLIIGDVIIFAASLAVALVIRHGGIPDPVVVELYRFAAPFLIGLWFFGFAAFGLYDLLLAKNETRFFARLMQATTANLVITVLLFYLVPQFGITPILTLAIIFTALTVLIFSWRTAANALLRHRARERVLFLGISDEVRALADFITKNPQFGYVVAGYLEPGENPTLNLPAPQISQADRIVVAHDLKNTPMLVSAFFELIPQGITITNFPRFYEELMHRVPVSLISETWFLENLIGSRRPRYEFLKRILDLTVAVLLGVVLLVLLPPVVMAIILATPREVLGYKRLRAHTGDGIIFFRQARVGRGGQPFGFVKFRSQRLGAQRLGWEKGSGPDPRAYPVGTFLRKTYLDELPQIWNIIKGEMSFVGPRPERPEFVREIEARIPFYRMRELVLPGITGWAQINMEYDASVEDAIEKLTYDLYYIKNRSIFLDLSIMLKTALKLLQRSGR